MHAKQIPSLSLLITPDLANFSGVMHGGIFLKFLDQAAYICAYKYCEKPVVTLNVNNVTFLKPIKIGVVLHFYTSINFTGNTSCEVGIKVIAENLQKNEFEHVSSGYITMVALEDGKSTKIKQFTPTSEEEKRRYNDAKERRNQILKNKKNIEK